MFNVEESHDSIREKKDPRENSVINRNKMQKESISFMISSNSKMEQF